MLHEHQQPWQPANQQHEAETDGYGKRGLLRYADDSEQPDRASLPDPPPRERYRKKGNQKQHRYQQHEREHIDVGAVCQRKKAESGNAIEVYDRGRPEPAGVDFFASG